MSTYKKTYCRFCLAFCGLKINIDENGTITNILGDINDPVSKGYTCEKGRNIAQYYSNDARLTKPKINNLISDWDTALSSLSKEIKNSIDKYGPDSVAFYQGTSCITDAAANWLALGFMYQIKSKMIYTVSTVDAVSKTFISNELTNDLLPGLIPQVDYDRTDCVLYVGTNPIVSHGHLAGNAMPGKKIDAIKSRGGKVLLLDPRRTETGKKADLHLRLKPGSDWAILGYVLKLLIKNIVQHKGLSNNKYIYVKYRKEIKSFINILEFIDINFVENITGLCRNEIDEFSKIILVSEALSGVSGTGISFANTGIVTEWFLWTILILKDQIDTEGGVLFNPGYPQYNFQNTIKESNSVKKSSYWSDVAIGRDGLPARMYEQPCAAIADAILKDKIKVLICVGGSPLTSLPNTRKNIKAFKYIPTLVDLNTHQNPNHKYSKYIYPICGQLERADSTIYAQNSLEFFGIKYTDNIINPYKDSKPAWWVFAKLGENLGFNITKTGKNIDEITDLDVLKTIKNGATIFQDEKLINDGIVINGPIPHDWINRKLYNNKWVLITPKLKKELSRIKKKKKSFDNMLKIVAFREKGKLNTMKIDSKNLNTFSIYFNNKLAKKEKIKNGDSVRVYSQIGSITGKAKISETMLDNNIGIPHGYFFKKNISNITSELLNVSLLTGMPLQTGFSCKITKA